MKTVEIDFYVGDKVFYVKNSEIQAANVTSIKINLFADGLGRRITSTEYYLDNGDVVKEGDLSGTVGCTLVKLNEKFLKKFKYKKQEK